MTGNPGAVGMEDRNHREPATMGTFSSTASLGCGAAADAQNTYIGHQSRVIRAGGAGQQSVHLYYILYTYSAGDDERTDFGGVRSGRLLQSQTQSVLFSIPSASS